MGPAAAKNAPGALGGSTERPSVECTLFLRYLNIKLTMKCGGAIKKGREGCHGHLIRAMDLKKKALKTVSVF